MTVQIDHIDSSNGTIIKLLRYSNTNSNTFDVKIFTPEELARFNFFKSPKRKAEFYYTRLLWNEFHILENIQYNALGRPHLKNGNISISHSRLVIAIAYHPTHPVGVDVEFHSPKLKKIQHKFISPEDRALIQIENEKMLTTVWSVKEAVYKMERIEGLSFKDNIHVRAINSGIEADVIKRNEIHHYNFDVTDFGDFVLASCSHANLNGTTLF